MDIPETVSLLNQERGNNQLYVSLVEGRPTYYSDDKTLPALPASVLNVLETERTSSRALVGSPESAEEQLAIPFDQVVSGSYSLRITVKVSQLHANFATFSPRCCAPRQPCARSKPRPGSKPKWPISKEAPSRGCRFRATAA